MSNNIEIHNVTFQVIHSSLIPLQAFAYMHAHVDYFFFFSTNGNCFCYKDFSWCLFFAEWVLSSIECCLFLWPG